MTAKLIFHLSLVFLRVLILAPYILLALCALFVFSAGFSLSAELLSLTLLSAICSFLSCRVSKVYCGVWFPRTLAFKKYESAQSAPQFDFMLTRKMAEREVFVSDYLWIVDDFAAPLIRVAQQRIIANDRLTYLDVVQMAYLNEVVYGWRRKGLLLSEARSRVLLHGKIHFD